MDPFKQVVTTISSVQVKEGDEGRLFLGEGLNSLMIVSYDNLIPLNSKITCKVGHIKSIVPKSCNWHRSTLHSNMYIYYLFILF